MTKVKDPDLIGALAIFAIGIIAIAAALTTPDPGFGVVGPAVLPTALGALVLVSAAWLAWEALTRRERAALDPLDRGPFVATLLSTAVYLAVFVPLGFILASAAYLVQEARILGSTRTVRDAIASAALVVGLYVLFVRLLGIELPRGPLPF
ncbi:MAG TPA: tripartite tricarboxylate transporter TctB family protein [Candidatus Limnocylindria bacterium]